MRWSRHMCYSSRKEASGLGGGRRKSPSAGVSVKGLRWTHVLLFLGAMSAMLNVSFVVKFDHARSDGSTGYLRTFLRTMFPENGDADQRRESRLQAWVEAVSSYVAAKGSLGWGERTGGVIIAGTAGEICGVPFEANTLRSKQEFPPVEFSANAAMVALSDDKKTCKSELEHAARSGWHQGQLFYYRLPVGRPGLYTVRLTVVFYHNDERRGDGITLGVEDLMEVRLNCAPTPGRMVVPINKIGQDLEESMGVVEFHTVAFGGEILLEAEGIYTCIGLSLIETFSHEEQRHRPLVVPDIASGENKIGRNVGGGGGSPTGESAAESVMLRAAWDDAGHLCAENYATEANRRSALQSIPASSTTAQDQRYFDEWARRERLEDSAGRYCRPHHAPRAGEKGWTWAHHSQRLLREREEEEDKLEKAREKGERATGGNSKTYFQSAVSAAVVAGVSPGTATILAAEAMDKAVEEAGDGPVTPAQGKEAVITAARIAMALVKARGGARKDPPMPISPKQVAAQALAQPLLSEPRRTVFDKGNEGKGPLDEVEREELLQRRRLSAVPIVSTPAAAAAAAAATALDDGIDGHARDPRSAGRDASGSVVVQTAVAAPLPLRRPQQRRHRRRLSATLHDGGLGDRSRGRRPAAGVVRGNAAGPRGRARKRPLLHASRSTRLAAAAAASPSADVTDEALQEAFGKPGGGASTNHSNGSATAGSTGVDIAIPDALTPEGKATKGSVGIAGNPGAPRPGSGSGRSLLGLAPEIEKVGRSTKKGSFAYILKVPALEGGRGGPGGGAAAAAADAAFADGNGEGDGDGSSSDTVVIPPPAAKAADGRHAGRGGVKPPPKPAAPGAGAGESEGDPSGDDVESAMAAAGGGRRINPEDPIPPPRCPSRLVALFEEALRVEAESQDQAAGETSTGGGSTPGATAGRRGEPGRRERNTGSQDRRSTPRSSPPPPPPPSPRSPGSEPGDSGWSPAIAVALLEDGAAAAADRARSRSEHGGGLGTALGRQLWEPELGRGVLPGWLGGIGGDWGQAEPGRERKAGGGSDGWGGGGEGRALPRSVVAQQALGSGLEAIAAYRAHEVLGWEGSLASGGGETGGPQLENTNDQGGRAEGAGKGRPPPVRLTGFTWDGITVVAKETVAGCARTARPPSPPVTTPPPRWDNWGVTWGWGGESGDEDDERPGSDDSRVVLDSELLREREGAGGDEPPAAAARGRRRKRRRLGASTGWGSGDDGGQEVDRMDSGGGGGDEGEWSGGHQPCLKVEAAFVPTSDIVVDIVVPVSAGLVPRLLTLLPQMEKLARGAGCTAHPPSHPQAPQCTDADHYAPAFWPERLSVRGDPSTGWNFDTDASEVVGGPAGDIGGGGGGGVRVNVRRGLRGGGGAADGSGGGSQRTNFRVVVATEDPGVEALLDDYDVDTVFVLSKAPFSKAMAIQDASAFIPDDHIMFVHDADLFPPCTLPDALRQTVVRGVQAVNLLLAYENQPVPGNCLYPLSTFGPMAMYASDFRAVGGIADANSGRWGYEDTAFLHKVMLGNKSLGVLRVHLPGLVHRWHEITPWKCLVWVWGGTPSLSASAGDGESGGGGAPPLVVKNTEKPPPKSAADVLGA